jgi:hypothetical protein
VRAAGNIVDRTILKTSNIKGNWQATSKDMVSPLVPRREGEVRPGLYDQAGISARLGQTFGTTRALRFLRPQHIVNVDGNHFRRSGPAATTSSWASATAATTCRRR